MKNKINRYIISGAILTYFALKDLNNFDILYNGIALAAGITAFIFAYLEFKKQKQNNQ